jgi:hypothetical protein
LSHRWLLLRLLPLLRLVRQLLLWRQQRLPLLLLCWLLLLLAPHP